jgi:hypothetical protein
MLLRMEQKMNSMKGEFRKYEEEAELEILTLR